MRRREETFTLHYTLIHTMYSVAMKWMSVEK
jgi:hypothetical protein